MKRLLTTIAEAVKQSDAGENAEAAAVAEHVKDWLRAWSRSQRILVLPPRDDRGSLLPDDTLRDILLIHEAIAKCQITTHEIGVEICKCPTVSSAL